MRLQAGQTLNFSLCPHRRAGQFLPAGIKAGSAWRARVSSLLQGSSPQRPQPGTSEPSCWQAGLLLQPRCLSGALFSHTWAFDVSSTSPCPPCCSFCSNPGHERQLPPHECMLQLMKRFGSFRGSKKRKERCKVLERRHSDPQGLSGKDPLHLERMDTALWERVIVND